jgi:cytidylate kinase
MMATDTMQALESLIKAIAMEQRQQGVGKPKQGCVITVSRACGSGGEQIARSLAQRLKVGYFDQEIIATIAHEAHVDQYAVAMLDEQARGLKASWLLSMLTGEPLFKNTYRRILFNVVFGILRTGGVIVGRGANFILEGQNAFRVRITGTETVCAKRISEHKDMPHDKALALVRETNRERADFIKALCKRDINIPEAYDLGINTDHVHTHKAPEVILLAMRYYTQEK